MADIDLIVLNIPIPKIYSYNDANKAKGRSYSNGKAFFTNPAIRKYKEDVGFLFKQDYLKRGYPKQTEWHKKKLHVHFLFFIHPNRELKSDLDNLIKLSQDSLCIGLSKAIFPIPTKGAKLNKGKIDLKKFDDRYIYKLTVSKRLVETNQALERIAVSISIYKENEDTDFAHLIG